MRRFSPTLIGIFVLGALVVAAIGIVSFGGQAWWRDREYVVLFFEESVHGLDRGSAVRLMGVRVGQVAAINVRYTDEAGTQVQVLCEIDSSPTLGTDFRARATLEEMAAAGLQARLDLIGITGMLFVEMDFFGVPEERALRGEHSEYVVIPTVSSALTGMADTLADIAQQFGEVDFAAIGESAKLLLDTVRETLEEARIDELFEQLNTTVASVQELMESAELKQAIAAAGESFDRIGALAERLEEQVEPMTDHVAATADELRAVLETFGSTLVAVQDLLGPRMGVGQQLGQTLETVEDAARSVERLAEFLERNPQAILRGTAVER